MDLDVTIIQYILFRFMPRARPILTFHFGGAINQIAGYISTNLSLNIFGFPNSLQTYVIRLGWAFRLSMLEACLDFIFVLRYSTRRSVILINNFARLEAGPKWSKNIFAKSDHRIRHTIQKYFVRCKYLQFGVRLSCMMAVAISDISSIDEQLLP